MGVLPELTMTPKPVAVAYRDGARTMCAGFLALAGVNSNELDWSAVVLAGVAVEDALKAFVAKMGGGPPQHTHDLVILWGQACALGAPLPPTPPLWCIELSALTNFPFEARYHAAHANQQPPVKTMVVALPTLIATLCP